MHVEKWWERKWKLVYRSGPDKEGCTFFEVYEDAAIIRDFLLGLRTGPTTEEVKKIHAAGRGLAYAVPLGEVIDFAEVVPTTNEEFKDLRQRARTHGHVISEDDY